MADIDDFSLASLINGPNGSPSVTGDKNINSECLVHAAIAHDISQELVVINPVVEVDSVTAEEPLARPADRVTNTVSPSSSRIFRGKESFSNKFRNIRAVSVEFSISDEDPSPNHSPMSDSVMSGSTSPRYSQSYRGAHARSKLTPKMESVSDVDNTTSPSYHDAPLSQLRGDIVSSSLSTSNSYSSPYLSLDSLNSTSQNSGGSDRRLLDQLQRDLDAANRKLRALSQAGLSLDTSRKVSSQISAMLADLDASKESERQFRSAVLATHAVLSRLVTSVTGPAAEDLQEGSASISGSSLNPNEVKEEESDLSVLLNTPSVSTTLAPVRLSSSGGSQFSEGDLRQFLDSELKQLERWKADSTSVEEVRESESLIHHVLSAVEALSGAVFASAGQVASRFQQELVQQKRELTRVHEELSQLRNECIHLQSELSAARGDLHTATEALDTASSEIRSLRVSKRELHAQVQAMESAPDCARCRPFEPPVALPGDPLPTGPWLPQSEALRRIEAAAAVKLVVLAPSVRVSLEGADRGAPLSVSPEPPLLAIKRRLREDVFPKFTSVFSLPLLRRKFNYSGLGNDSEWIGGPQPSDDLDDDRVLADWLRQLSRQLENDVEETLKKIPQFKDVINVIKADTTDSISIPYTK